MRKIEQEMVNAVTARKAWQKDNTTVSISDHGAKVYLHGNPIAYFDKFGRGVCNVDTLANWPTVTTKSRLRALGFNVETRKGRTYLDGVLVE